MTAGELFELTRANGRIPNKNVALAHYPLCQWLCSSQLGVWDWVSSNAHEVDAVAISLQIRQVMAKMGASQ
jgi:hypothetical protein